MSWTNEHLVTQEEIENKEGFVYEIYDKQTKLTYIGIKRFKAKVTRKPLKGRTNKRHDFKESNWRTYTSSNPEWKDLIKSNPERFVMTIIRVCDTVTELKAWEAHIQLGYYIRGEWSKLQNEMINLRIRIRKQEDEDTN